MIGVKSVPLLEKKYCVPRRARVYISASAVVFGGNLLYFYRALFRALIRV